MAATRTSRNGRKGVLEPTQAKRPDFQEYGVSGTKLFAGIISEETVPQLQGFNAFKTYQGMRLDATGSALLKAIELPIRSARWFVNPASDDPKDVDIADFVHSVLWEFGSQSFDDVARLALGMLAFGFSFLEIVWSVIEDGPWKGKVGWDKLGWRSQAPLALDTPIATPDGWTTMADVEVGDRIYDENGLIRSVVTKSPVLHDHRCFEVVFESGDRILADADHRWLARDLAGGRDRKAMVVTTAEMTQRNSGAGTWAIDGINPSAGHVVTHYVVGINKVPSVPVQCLGTDAPSELFLAGRSMVPTKNTKWRWNMDFVNGKRQLVSVTQLAPPYYQQIELPRNKLLLWVNDLEGDNFDGISALRPAWKDYFIRDQLYRIRAIGLERGFMGVPVATFPDEFSDELKGVAKQIVETVRTDEQVGVVHPAEMEFRIEHWELNGPAINAAIDYHNRQMLLAQLAQFLELGAKSVGSYALSSDQSDLFQMCVNAKANYFAEVMNLHPGIPQLVGFNFPNVASLDLPRLEHGDIGQRSLDKLGRTLMALGQWGFLTPDDATEDRLRQMLDLPEREEAITDKALYDLIQQVMPTDVEYGRMHPAARLQSPLQTQALTAQAKAQQALKAPPAAADAPQGKGTPSERNASSVDFAERAARIAANRAELAELVARKGWARPRGRPTPGQRMAMRATEAVVEALEDVFHAGERRPERPSIRMARLRRPYQVQAAEQPSGRLLEPGQPRTLLTRQMAIARAHREPLRAILRPRGQPPPPPTTAPVRSETTT